MRGAARRGRPAEWFDAFVLARGLGRAGDPDVQFEIYRALDAGGAVLVNRLEPLLAAQDKFRSSWLLARAGVPTPRAAVAQTPDDAERALAALGEAVAKPVAGSLGDGVERLRPDAAGRRRRARARRRATERIYLQEYVPHPGRGSPRLRRRRARRARPSCGTRPRGEWRTNVAGGRRAEAVALGAELAAVAEAAAAALGLDYAGVDMVDGPARSDGDRGEREPQLAGDPRGDGPRHGGGHRRARARPGAAPARTTAIDIRA